jgi:DNA-3-methyladenine glycosylase
VEVARALLGCTLSVRGPDSPRTVRLVEVEAYVAHDAASHTYRGPTRRNRSMFEAPGTLYMFRIHQVVCANLVTRRGEAVLLRAGAPVVPDQGNPSGPGRLCRFLDLQIADDGRDVTSDRRVRVDPRDPTAPPFAVRVGRRIGISRATRRRLRFSVANDPWVSRPWP